MLVLEWASSTLTYRSFLSQDDNPCMLLATASCFGQSVYSSCLLEKVLPEVVVHHPFSQTKNLRRHLGVFLP